MFMKKNILQLAAFACTIVLSTLSSYGTIVAADDYESYVTTLNYGDNGGFGLGALNYLEGTGGGVYLETGAAKISGSQSMGIFSNSGVGNTQAADRALTTSLAFGEYDVQARFNLSNTVAFSGFNIKSAEGGGFGTNELLSFGLDPSTAVNTIFVSGAINQTIDLGTEVRGPVIDFQLLFDTLAGTFTLGAKIDGAGSYTTVSGNLKSSGANVAALGFANFNTGGSQNLIVDNISVVPEPSSISLILTSIGIGGAFLARKRRI
jgi:hypothetical protein